MTYGSLSFLKTYSLMGFLLWCYILDASFLLTFLYLGEDQTTQKLGTYLLDQFSMVLGFWRWLYMAPSLVLDIFSLYDPFSCIRDGNLERGGLVISSSPTSFSSTSMLHSLVLFHVKSLIEMENLERWIGYFKFSHFLFFHFHTSLSDSPSCQIFDLSWLSNGVAHIAFMWLCHQVLSG